MAPPLHKAISQLSAAPQGNKPVTLGMPPVPESSRLASCVATVVTRSSRAPRSRPSCRAQRSDVGIACLGARIQFIPDRLYFTASDEANALIATDPMALLVGFVLDQQVSVEKAFSGPLALKERLGTFDASTLAEADLEPVFRTTPAIHRYPSSMAKRVHDLAVHVLERYDGDAARVWGDAGDAGELRANIAALPGFGEMKIKSLSAVLAKRYKLKKAKQLVPPHPTLGDVDSLQALADYQAAKRVNKAQWSKMKSRDP